MLTPVDIRSHIFKAGMGGNYNSKEVNEFIDLVAGDYETLFKENEDLKSKITELNEGVQYYKNMESTLQKALLHAQMEADKVIAEANEEAQSITNGANEQAEATLSQANEQAEATLSQANEEAETLRSSSKEEADTMLREATEKSEALTKEAEEKHSTLMSEATEKSEAMVKEATEKSEKMLADAQTETDNMLKTKNDELKDINAQIDTIQKCFDDFKTKFVEVLNLQLKSVEDGSFDVKVDGLEDAVKASKDTIAKNDEMFAQNAKDQVERINAFDDPSEELDKDGLNASGLNFDIDRSANAGITIDDPVEEPVVEEAAPEVAMDEVPVDEVPVEEVPMDEAPEAAPAGSDFGFVSNENANGYEMPDMQDEFDTPVDDIPVEAPVEEVPVEEMPVEEAPAEDASGDNAAGGFTFIDA
ncbi:MAG: DivIVA domain-containing protein [Lachnospiraceae bacterium]|nr:DivIVA domain-containing protein [Lachnospiraceae bacterium]